MAIPGTAFAMETGSQRAFSPGLDMTSIITRVLSAEQGRALPRGSVIGDIHGGLTFSDDIAAVLESRSLVGWQEVEPVPGGDKWTVITLDH